MTGAVRLKLLVQRLYSNSFVMFVSFAWVTEHSSAEWFEAEVPFGFVGEQLGSFGGHFVIIFLAGFDRLSRAYTAQLRQAGFDLVDYSAETRQLERNFSGLGRFGDYGCFCFLRWLALHQYVQRENITEQIIHLDGDVVFNASPAEIAHDLSGRTFVLQGCPALASISDHRWLDQYAGALVDFSRDPDCYCARAWSERAGLEDSSKQRWAGFWPQPLFTHDQDLISYLIHTEKIIQDHPAAFARDLSLYYAQNPFWLHEGAALQLGRSSGLDFSIHGRACFLEGKKIAFWHFQSFYTRHMNSAVVTHRAGYRGRFPDENACTPFEKWCWEHARQLSPLSRAQLYGSIRELSHSPTEADFSFADFYNARRFCLPGIFVNDAPL